MLTFRQLSLKGILVHAKVLNQGTGTIKSTRRTFFVMNNFIHETWLQSGH